MKVIVLLFCLLTIGCTISSNENIINPIIATNYVYAGFINYESTNIIETSIITIFYTNYEVTNIQTSWIYLYLTNMFTDYVIDLTLTDIITNTYKTNALTNMLPVIDNWQYSTNYLYGSTNIVWQYFGGLFLMENQYDYDSLYYYEWYTSNPGQILAYQATYIIKIESNLIIDGNITPYTNYIINTNLINFTYANPVSLSAYPIEWDTYNCATNIAITYNGLTFTNINDGKQLYYMY